MAVARKLYSCAFTFVAALLVLQCRSVHGEAFYTGTDVVELTPETLKSKVLDDHRIWMIEFYAPWCGHCQRLKADYIKAATASKGIVHFGAINADEHKSVGGQYGVRGFPTLKIFGVNKKNPEDYNGARSAKAMSDALIAMLPNLVSVISGNAYNKFLEKVPDMPKAVLFTSKSSTTALYKALALDLKDRMALAEVRAKGAGKLLEERNIDEADLPVLLVYPVGEAEAEPIKYDGELKHKPLVKFLVKYALPKKDKAGKSSKKASDGSGQTTASSKSQTSSPPSPKRAGGGGLKEVKTAADVQQHCSKGVGFCVLTLLSGGDSSEVDKVTALAAKFSKDPLKFVWADAAKHPKLKALLVQEDVEGGQSGPLTAILNPKRRKFALHAGLDGLEAMLDRALGGDLVMSAKLTEDWEQVLDS